MGTISKPNKLLTNKYLYAGVFMLLNVTMLTINPAFADASISSIVSQMIEIIAQIFVAVGVILAVYSVGQLIMAFKNEDADSKSRASTMLVVAIVLVAFPTLIEKLDLISYITK